MMRRVLLLLVVAVMAGFLFSCGSTTTSRAKQQEAVTEETQVEGTAAGMPLSVKVRRRLIRQSVEDSTSSTKIDWPDVPWQEVGQAALGGITSSIPGVGGLAGLALAAFAWIKKRGADKALKQTISGLDDARREMGDDAWKESVAPHLQKAQDEDVRSTIKKKQTKRTSE